MAVRHDPLAALRQPSFALFASGRFAAAAAQTLLHAAIAWQVYEISGSVLQLALLGLARFVPQLLATLVAGAAADSFDRKRIVLAAEVVPAVCSLVLIAATESGEPGLPLIYGLVVLIGLASAFENPARQALLPSVVTKETFANAIMVSATIQSLAFAIGPAVAGITIALLGVSGAYAVNAGLMLVAMGTLVFLHPRPLEAPRRALSYEALKEGVQFVWHRQPLLGSMTLDMFAVILGGATALLPVYASDILDVGPLGYGLLVASLDVGALLMSVILVVLPPVQRTGRALLLAVAGFGLATIVFGLSRSLPLSIAAYMAVGMTDQISVVMRQTTVQLSTPDELRGRVSAVNMLFIGTSNQLGAVESGLLAAATSATFAVVSGGVACLGVVGVVAAKMPELRDYKIERQPATAPLAGQSQPAEEPVSV
jgi:MFS family permease